MRVFIGQQQEAMNRHRARAYLMRLGAHKKVADLYDDDEMLRMALSALIPDFEYPDWSHRTIGQVVGKVVQYERWGTSTGREGIQRTLDSGNAQDQQFLAEGIRMVDEHGRARALTTEEANTMGIRRCVAAKDIHTGELKWREDPPSTPFFVVKAR